MSDCLRLYIHESSAERCTAKGLHRSGSRVRPVSFNDILYGSDNETPCGVVMSVETERIDRENWLYRIAYVPEQGTLHPIDSFVVWRQPAVDGPQQVIVPQVVSQRMQQTVPVAAPIEQPTPVAKAPIRRRRRNKKQSVLVNGQQGKAAQASAVNATAIV